MHSRSSFVNKIFKKTTIKTKKKTNVIFVKTHFFMEINIKN